MKWALLTLTMIFVVFADSSMDVIEMKNGSIYKGIILEQNDEKVVLVLPGGDQITCLKADIAFIKADKASSKPVNSVDMGQKMFRPQAYRESQMFNTPHTQKDPFVAFGLSLLILGLGQHYNEEHFAGLAFEGIGIGCGLVMLNEKSDQDTKQIAGLILGLTWAWSIIDAPVSANRINRQGRYALSIQPDKDGAKLSICYNF